MSIGKRKPSLLFSPARWRGEMKRKDFNGITHFGSLPQGERRDGRKNFKRPLTLALSHKVERDRKKEKLCKDLNEFLT
jgi:hypothetical protein